MAAKIVSNIMQIIHSCQDCIIYNADKSVLLEKCIYGKVHGNNPVLYIFVALSKDGKGEPEKGPYWEQIF